MRRQRLTWQQRGGADRRASAHPAYPDEGPASPAYKPDPEADAYENGDTSSWAEDPHPGPYPNSAHPAYPDEGPASPAYKAASLERALEKKAARCLRLASALMGPGAPQMAVEDQALSLMDLSDRAINASLARLAGDEPSEEAEEAAPEKSEAKKKARTIKALLRMIADEDEEEADEDAEEVEEADEEVEVEAKKKASVRRFAKKAEDASDDAEKAVEEAEDAADVVEGTKEEAKKKAALRRLARAIRAAEGKVEEAEGKVEEAEDKGEGDKKASRRLAKIRRDFNEVRRAFRHFSAAEDGDEGEDEGAKEEAKKKASSRRRAYGWAMTPHMGDDATLEQMLKEEGMGADDGEDAAVEAMLAEMKADEGADPEVEAMLAEMMTEDDAPAAAPAEAMYEEDVAMDPLGVLTDDVDDGLTDDDYMLASLFGMKAAAEDEGSKEDKAEDKAEADAKKEEAAKKEARLRPQPKTASTGATRLGGGVIGKSATSEVSELSALWESAPDVSKFF